MCLMAPARVVDVDTDSCRVVAGGRVERVSWLFVDEELSPGDWVLVVGDSALRKLEPDQAAAMRRAFGLANAPLETPSLRNERG